MIGDSIPFWAGVWARNRGQPHLNLRTATVGWWCKRGMSWSQFRHSIEANVLLSTPPKVVLIHLGGNDLVSKSQTFLRNIIQREIKYLSTAFPESVLVWVDILPRICWGPHSYAPGLLDAKLRRINRWGRQQIRRHTRSDAISIDIDLETPGFFRQDGVHLSDVGLAFYVDAIRDAILRHL